MKNILTIECEHLSNNGVVNQDGDNMLLLMIRPLSTQLTNIKVVATHEDTTIEQSETLSITDSGLIEFEMPFTWFSAAETLTVKLAADEADSDEITLTIAEDLTASDDYKVVMDGNNYTVKKIGSTETDLLDLIYPVGSIYMSVNNVSPEAFIGGTWEQIKDTFLLSAGDTYSAGSTGGEAEHTLTVAEMPSHTHLPDDYWSVASASNTGRQAVKFNNSQYGSESGGIPSKATGGGQAHNNMPPYLTVYVWKRVS